MPLTETAFWAIVIGAFIFAASAAIHDIFFNKNLHKRRKGE